MSEEEYQILPKGTLVTEEVAKAINTRYEDAIHCLEFLFGERVDLIEVDPKAHIGALTPASQKFLQECPKAGLVAMLLAAVAALVVAAEEATETETDAG